MADEVVDQEARAMAEAALIAHGNLVGQIAGHLSAMGLPPTFIRQALSALDETNSAMIQHDPSARMLSGILAGANWALRETDG